MNGKDLGSIKKNIRLRRGAEEVHELAETICQEGGWKDGEVQRFWEELGKLVALHLPDRGSDSRFREMAEDEAKRFGQEQMPFGEFAGMQVDQVPLERLQWYANQTFTDDLRRYLDSDRVKVEG
jgi:hypothetical protein